MPFNNNFPSLRFPEDVGTTAVPTYIRFTPQEVTYGGTRGNNPITRPNNALPGVGSSVTSIGGALNANNPINQIQNQIGGVVDNFANGAQQAVGAIGDVFNSGNLTTAFTNLGKVVSGRVNIGPFTLNLGQSTAPDELRSNGSINLYLPDALATNSSVEYSATEIGAVGATATDVAGESREGQLNAVEGATRLGAATFTDLLRASSNISAVNQLSRGVVGNNFSFQIFNGVSHRTFSYSFKMVAKNEKESRSIKDICDTFLYYMLPARTTEQEAGDTLHFYEVPAQWKIEYKKMGNLLEFHQQPKACFLNQVEVAYGGDAQNALYSDGAPMDVTLNLSFVEIEPLYRQDNLNRSEPLTNTEGPF